MAKQRTYVVLPPQQQPFWRPAAALALCVLLAACGGVDYDFDAKNTFAPASKQRNIGSVRVHYNDDTTAEIRVRRVPRGYAVQAPFYETKDASVQFTTSHTSEQKLFIGVQSRFAF
jgi:hypothetical protein